MNIPELGTRKRLLEKMKSPSGVEAQYAELAEKRGLKSVTTILSMQDRLLI
jgi:hypothetical protein